jgi:TRAP-type uncharacterized transport system fused permease subunit
MFFKKKEKKALSPEEQMRILNEKMERTRPLSGIVARLCFILAVTMSLFHLYSSGIHMLPQFQLRAIHLAFALGLTFFIYPVSKRYKDRLPWFDIMIIIFSL